MKILIVASLLIVSLSSSGLALDECVLMGNYAVQFTQYRDSGKSLTWVLNYISKNISYNRQAYEQIARAVYSGSLNPRQNRIVIENMCRDARGN